MANASEQLLQVQDEISNMESALFGKVVNSEKVGNLYAQHEATEASNQRLEDDISRLTEQIAGLSLQLAQLQRGYVAKGKEYRLHERQLRGEVVQSEATAEGLDVELTKGRKVDVVHAELTKSRERLAGDAARISKQGHAAVKELDELRNAAAAEEGRSAALRKELLDLHNLGVTCHSDVGKEEKDLVAEEAVLPAATAAAGKAEQHMVAAAKADEARAAAEGLILRGEVLDAETDGQHALVGLQDVQGRLKGLEVRLVSEVRGLNDRVNATKGQIKTVVSSLAVNTGVSSEDKARKHAVQVKLSAIQQEVSPVFFASLEAENDVYTAELKDILVNVTSSKSAEATAVIAAQEAEAELEAQKLVEATNRKALEEAQAESTKQIDAATKETSQKVAASAAMEQQAKDALAAKCAQKWMARKETKDAALATCASQRAELAVLNAQKDSLEATLQAANAGA